MCVSVSTVFMCAVCELCVLCGLCVVGLSLCLRRIFVCEFVCGMCGGPLCVRVCVWCVSVVWWVCVLFCMCVACVG